MSEQLITSKYTFVCDPDECDVMFEVTTSDGFGFPSGITKLKCPCGRDTTLVSTSNSTSLDVQRYNQPNRKENQMETITASITDYSPTVAVHDIKEQISTLEAQINTLRDTLTRERANVRNLYTNLNDAIEDNELNADDTITYGELSEILSSVFSSELSFLKEYQAFVEFKVRVTLDYKSASSSDAEEIAQSIGLDISDDIVNYDGEAEVNEIYVEDTRVLSVEEQ